MTYNIREKTGFVEVNATGNISYWDLLKIVHDLYKRDPKKEIPDLWVLDENFDFPLCSYSPLIQGILKLASRCGIKRGCESATLAADEFQRIKVAMYCTEASALPYDIQAFTSRETAVAWLLD
jgi:hypothetical protein